MSLPLSFWSVKNSTCTGIALNTYIMMLESYGAEAIGARSAREALSLFSQFRPHVLISDLNLPDESGYFLLREIRALSDAEGGSVSAIALTAYNEESFRMRALLAGFQLYVVKPISLRDIMILVDKLCQQSTVLESMH